MTSQASDLLIAFDLDGTLEDSRQDMVNAVHRVRQALSVPPRADEDIRPHVNRGMDHLYRTTFDDVLASAGDRTAYDEIRESYLQQYADRIADHTHLYPGVKDALESLRGRGQLAVVTNKPEFHSDLLLKALGIRHHFAAVVGGDSCSAAKPDPVMLRTALERSQLPADARVVMVGDTNGDLQVARAHGATSIWCRWGYVESVQETPDFIAETPADLLGLVAAIVDQPTQA